MPVWNNVFQKIISVCLQFCVGGPDATDRVLDDATDRVLDDALIKKISDRQLKMNNTARVLKFTI